MILFVFSEKDFCAVYGTGSALIVTLDPQYSPYCRWIISIDRSDSQLLALNNYMANRAPPTTSAATAALVVTDVNLAPVLSLN
jgi:hypothetical protein